jgi:hypothetical protein
MGQYVYFTEEELQFLRYEALEDVPDTYLSEKEKSILAKLKEKSEKAIRKQVHNKK